MLVQGVAHSSQRSAVKSRKMLADNRFDRDVQSLPFRNGARRAYHALDLHQYGIQSATDSARPFSPERRIVVATCTFRSADSSRSECALD